MNFDTFLAQVGDWGRFQKVKYGLICLTYMLPPIMVYTYTFTAAKPDFRCQNPQLLSEDRFDNQSNLLYKSRYIPTDEQCKRDQNRLSVKECQRCYTQYIGEENQDRSAGDVKLEKCTRFVFDKTHYEKTLVEEVRTPRHSHSSPLSSLSFSGTWSAIVSPIDPLCK